VLNSAARRVNPSFPQMKALVIVLYAFIVTFSTAVDNSCKKLGTKLWILWIARAETAAAGEVSDRFDSSGREDAVRAKALAPIAAKILAAHLLQLVQR
jgi:hypothetical protein